MMSLLRPYYLPYFLIILLSGWGCSDDCDPTLNDEAGDEFFTLTYQGTDGSNLLETRFNPSEVFVYLDTTGGRAPEPPIELIRPAINGNMLGPFFYTRRFINPALEEINGIPFYNVVHTFDYHINKGDGLDEDVLRVEFLYEVGKCNRQWRFIRYFLNEELLSQYNDVENAEIVVVE